MGMPTKGGSRRAVIAWLEPMEPRLLLAADLAVLGNDLAIVAGDASPDPADGSDFGTLNVARSQQVRTFTLRNVGDEPLTLASRGRVRLEGPQRSNFKVIRQPARVIGPGESTTVQVRFDPRAAGLQQAQLTIVSSDADTPRYSFAVQGTGLLAPVATVVRGKLTIAAGDDTPSLDDGTDFGATSSLAQRVSRTFRLRNLGSQPLTLGDEPRISIGGEQASDFTLVKQPAATLRPGASSTFRIIFQPRGAGLRQAEVTLASNDPAVPSYTFTVQGQGPTSQPLPALTTRRIANGLDNPLYVTAPPGDTQRLFIVEKGSGDTAAIRILPLGTQTLHPEPFLTITGITTDGERGLLGLAFDPDYAANRRFFVALTNGQGDTEIRRYTASASDPDRADPDFTLVLGVEQPFSNHNGGWLGFGPDGYLYIALGDGGSGNDPQQNAQNLDSLLGKILRIDTDGTALGAYSVPADNPFVGTAGRDEIWAYGLRNPWRASFDRASGDLWIGDVGQNQREEINRLPAGVGGLNLGWRAREGSIDNPGVSDDAPSPRHEPVLDYPRNLGRSVTGGYVYRGSEIPSLAGAYFFADFVTARIWALRGNDVNGQGQPEPVELTSDLDPDGDGPLSISQIASFGEDAAGNLYLVSLGGDVFRLIEPA